MVVNLHPVAKEFSIIKISREGGSLMCDVGCAGFKFFPLESDIFVEKCNDDVVVTLEIESITCCSVCVPVEASEELTEASMGASIITPGLKFNFCFLFDNNFLQKIQIFFM